MRKLIAGAGLILLLVVTMVTVYYHFQHKIEIIYYPVNERVLIEDHEIMVKYISKTAFKNNWREPSWLMNQTWLIEKLPIDAFYGLAKINYFYSKPYEFNDDSYNYNIHLEVLNDNLSVEEDMSMDHIKIRLLYGETDNVYSANSHTYSRKGNATTMLATQEIENRPSMVPRALSFESEDKGQIKNIEITQPPKSIKYNFFNRKDIIRDKSAGDVASDFLYGLQHVEEKKITTETDQAIRDRYLELQELMYDLQYMGDYGQYEDVYIMSVSDRDVDQPSIKLYMVYENLTWVIIEVEPKS
ncbi:hypothetical protein [Petrocella sp. FN5]|uniref:hypothetical protein n=1 Tax=Petrocella sp. FN5 TaxID=3032002 RepID=UPI0023DCC123|nr:hypothetical protein [Petrocella sp. FN5]MDF1618634.1 hypothetical protein [Petrocella sp. FN5]